MSTTIWGQVADGIGACHVAEFVRTAAGPRVINRRFAARSTDYRRTQIAAPLTVEHRSDQQIGRLLHLELTDDKKLLAVAVSDEDITGDWYYSPTISLGGGDPIDLRELTVTKTPGSIAQPRVNVVAGDISNRFSVDRILGRIPSRRDRELLERANQQAARGGPIEVRTATDLSTPERFPQAYPIPVLPAIEIRPGGPILSVS